MISFAVMVCLLALSEGAKRRDYVGFIRPTANTHWGSWGPEDWCLEDQFAYGFSLKVEGKQHGGDDTAVNGIKLHCSSFCGAHTHDISSKVQRWGRWKHSTYCPKYHFLKAVAIRSEKGQGGGDDTAVNDFDLICESSLTGGDLYRLRGQGMPWGTWSKRAFCPSGSYICGIKTRVENPQGSGDDTALNEAIFYCCKFKAQ